MDIRGYKAHDGDTVFIEKSKFQNLDLRLGHYISFNDNGNTVLHISPPIGYKDTLLRLIEVIKTKKRWFQFWKRRTIIGYIFYVIHNKLN